MAPPSIIDPAEILEGLGLGLDVFPFSYVWPSLDYFHQTGKPDTVMRNYLTVMTICVVSYTILSLYALFVTEMTMTRQLSAVMNPIAGLQMLFKYFVLTKKLKDYMNMMILLKKDFLCCIPEDKMDEVRVVIRKTALSSNKFIRFAIHMNISVVFILCITPILNSPQARALLNIQPDDETVKPLYSEYPFDWTYSPVYEFIIFYETLSLSVGVLMSNIFQVILLLLVTALVTQLNALGYVITSMKASDITKSKDRRMNETERKIVLKQLVKCVVDHQRLTAAGSELGDRFDFFLTIQLPTSIMILEIVVIGLILATTSKDFCRLISVAFFAFGEVALYCYLGQMLETASDDLSRHIYSCEWDTMDADFRKMASLMMARTHHPISLRAGRIYRLNIDTLAGVLQLICSSYTGFSKIMSL